jgi:hypothetical protein
VGSISRDGGLASAGNGARMLVNRWTQQRGSEGGARVEARNCLQRVATSSRFSSMGIGFSSKHPAITLCGHNKTLELTPGAPLGTDAGI